MRKILGGHRPDLTPAHVGAFLLAGVPIVANLLHAFGVYTVTPEQESAIKDTVQWGVIGGGALALADTGLRAARNHADAKVKAAALIAPSTPPDATAPPAPVITTAEHNALVDQQRAQLEEFYGAGAVSSVFGGAGSGDPVPPPEDLPSDEDEFAAPPPGVPPVQPSQVAPEAEVPPEEPES